ncbi:MAG TPA: hypothetical protein VFQ52_10000, partial [Rhizomicrobium sp.]|nr:hypothetical protein [Rhizomicrobium sp.]
MARFTRAIQSRNIISANFALLTLDGPRKVGHDREGRKRFQDLMLAAGRTARLARELHHIEQGFLHRWN